eukprot:scaffold3504_cov112-Skeletonema_marinoi.AAC.3
MEILSNGAVQELLNKSRTAPVSATVIKKSSGYVRYLLSFFSNNFMHLSKFKQQTTRQHPSSSDMLSLHATISKLVIIT